MAMYSMREMGTIAISQELDMNELSDLGFSGSLNEINGKVSHEDKVLGDQESKNKKNEISECRYGGKKNSRKMERRISFEMGINGENQKIVEG
jgi:hypothetical protein